MVTIDMSGTGKKIKAQMVCADLTARDIADACGCKVDDLIAVK